MSRLNEYLEAAYEIKEKESQEAYEKEGKVVVRVQLPEGAIDQAAIKHNDAVIEAAVNKRAKEKGVEPSKALIKEIKITDADLKPVINFKAIEAHDKKEEMKVKEPESPEEALKPAKTNTVAEKLLRFIESKGEAGVGLSEIQRYMFKSAGRDISSGSYRGWYISALYGSARFAQQQQRPNIGLFRFWCEPAATKGKWKLKKGVIIAPPFYRLSPNNQPETRKEEKEIPKGKYARFIQKAYELNKPLGYMDLVELLETGSVGKWTTEQRRNNRGLAAGNFGSSYGVGILAKWFDHVDKKYVPKEKLRELVASGKIAPFRGTITSHLKK